MCDPGYNDLVMENKIEGKRKAKKVSKILWKIKLERGWDSYNKDSSKRNVIVYSLIRDVIVYSSSCGASEGWMKYVSKLLVFNSDQRVRGQRVEEISTGLGQRVGTR